METTKRISLFLVIVSTALATSAVAFAEPTRSPQPRAEGQGAKRLGDKGGKGGRFKKADKNNDGFLTKDEVGEQRWDRIKVADLNRDNKVSKPELKQAKKDGKLPKGKDKKA